MPTQVFRGGRIRQADYDPSSRVLQLRWDDGRVLAYQAVPHEVFRRLCSAPNPATYWEDRIAEEYPRAAAGAAPAPGGGAGPTLKDLFGDPPGEA